MIRSHAPGFVPKNIRAEIRRRPCRSELARDPQPLRCHGSPASWLLPKRINTQLCYHPRRGEIDREPAATRSCKIPARRWGFESSSGYLLETHHLSASVGASLLAIRNHCVVTDRPQGTERPFGAYESKTTVIFAGLTGATLLANRPQLCAYQKLRPGAGDRAVPKCDGGEV